MTPPPTALLPSRPTPQVAPPQSPDPGPEAPRSKDPHTAPLPPGAAPPRRVRAVDGLRALAVAAVVVYHAWPAVLPGGYLGVDVFFVISGFVITASLVHVRRADGRPRLGRFWVRRAQRLLPALAALLLTIAALAAVVGDAVTVRLREQLLAALTFTGNWYQAGSDVSYFDEAQPPLLQHLWSLAVEEQFYLVWPLLLVALLAVVRRPRTRVLVVALGALASAGAMAWLFAPGDDPSRLYFGTDTHGFGLLLGAAAALAVPLLATPPSHPGLALVQRCARSRVLPIAAAAVVVVAMARLADDLTLTYRGGIAGVCVATALLLVSLLVRPGGPVRRLLAQPVVVWVGVRSYAIYLWHWPVLVLLDAAFPTASPHLRGALTVYLTLLAAALSWRYVEQPVLRHGFRGAGRRLQAAVRRDAAVRGPLLVLATLTLVVAAGSGLRAAPDRGEVESLVLAGQAAADGSAPAPLDPDAQDAPPTPAPLADAGPAEIGAQTIVLGDSVTLASANALLAELPGVAVSAEVGRQMDEAPALVDGFRAEGSLRPYLVVALGTNGAFDPATLDRLVDAAGPDTRLVLVTAHGDRDWMGGVNRDLLAYAEAHPAVGLARWDRASAYVPDFASDGIHPGDEGGVVFARLVADTLRALP